MSFPSRFDPALNFVEAHWDGSYETPDRNERSYFTLHLYLNSAGGCSEQEMDALTPKERLAAVKQGLRGGSTPFFATKTDDRLDVGAQGRPSAHLSASDSHALG